MYDDLVFNAKAQNLAPKLFKAWVNLMCLASKNEPRGQLPPLSQIAFGLHTNETSAQAILDQLHAKRFLEKLPRSAAELSVNSAEVWLIYGWTERQRNSDNVAQRVSKHRISRLPENVTLPKRFSNVLDTDSDTDSDTEQKRGEEKPASAPLPPQLDLLSLGEFGCAKMTEEEHRKLQAKLDGSLPGYIEDFDRWVHEAPKAKDSGGVKRENRHAYETIGSWYSRDQKKGTRDGHKTKTDRNAEAGARLLSRLAAQDRSGGDSRTVGSEPSDLFGALMPINRKPDR